MSDDRCPNCKIPWVDHNDEDCEGLASFEPIKKKKLED